jgi:hypothetical protein
MIEQQLYDCFAHESIIRGNEYYMERGVALQFIELCDKNDFAVIGIEGFWISGKTVSDSHWIADYSSNLRVRDWNQVMKLNGSEARRFVDSAPLGIRFSIVVLSRSEYEEGLVNV